MNMPAILKNAGVVVVGSSHERFERSIAFPVSGSKFRHSSSALQLVATLLGARDDGNIGSPLITICTCLGSASNVHGRPGIMDKYFSNPLFSLFHRKSDRWPSKGSVVALPPEIVDKILEHVPANRYGRQTLIACALVATWWTGPSQRRLFSSVEIGKDNRQRWMNGVVLSGSKARLLEYVRSFGYYPYFRQRMRDLAQYSGEYFPALCNLRSLALFNIRVERISEENFRTCFSAFRETLTHLSLDTFVTSFGAFVALVDYFPSITTLRLRSFDLEPDEGPVQSLSRPLRGSLHVHIHANLPEFANKFAKLNLEYEELVIDGSTSRYTETKFVESVLQIIPSTVKFLRLTAELQRKQPLPTVTKTASLLSPFTFKLKLC